jgi:hypothetical protein
MVIVMNAIVGITEAELKEYRALVADIEGMSDAEKEEAIRIVDQMMQESVAAAWRQHPVQQAALHASKAKGFHDMFNALGSAKPVDLVSEGAITKTRYKEPAP